MSKAAATVLDLIDNIKVPGNVFDQPANEYWALVCIRDGLEFLYRQAVRCDQQAVQCDQAAKEAMGLKENVNVKFVGLGSVPWLHRVPRTLLTCAFQWYAVSACNYVKLVGAIAYRQDGTRPRPAQYVEAEQQRQ